MKSTKRAFLILSVFLAGCFTATVAQPLLVPSANAEQANLPKWEYHCINSSTNTDKQTAMFNEFGKQGWELVGLSLSKPVDQTVCFKRKI